jgi:glucokinase
VRDVDLRQETQASLAEKLPQYDAVFVSGGNTFRLLECMKKSGFTALIKEFLEKGIIYIYLQVLEVVSVLPILNLPKKLMIQVSLNFQQMNMMD